MWRWSTVTVKVLRVKGLWLGIRKRDRVMVENLGLGLRCMVTVRIISLRCELGFRVSWSD